MGRRDESFTYRVAAVRRAAGRVQVLDDLLQVLRHPLQLRVHVLGQLVGSLALLVCVLHVDGAALLFHRLLQGAQQVLQLLLLRQDKVQLLVQPLLVQLHLLHLLVQRRDLLAVLHQHAVPGVDLRGLLQEVPLLVLQLQAPLVDETLKLGVGHRRRGCG